MAGDVVGEPGVVAEPGWRHAGTVPAVPEAPPSDLVVVGAGAAGLFASLTAAREGARVTLVSARPLAETASYWAQGGLAAALAVGRLAGAAPRGHADRRPRPRPPLGRRGPVRRGARALRRPRGVRRPLRRRPPRRPRARAGGRAPQAPRRPRRRQRDRPADPAPALGRRRRRRRGSTCSRAAASARCCPPPTAASTASRPTTGGRSPPAPSMLASGGAAALWSRTTNPPGSYGSGLMLARAAGAELADLEFVQFHPTAVVGITGREGFLVTEAIRGEGATLHDAAGERFVDELQPRDAVASAIHRLLVETGAPAVYLDMTAIDPARFPNVVDALREAGRRPGDRADPGLAREPLRDGRHHDRPRRPQHGRRALRRRRGRVHRPARREPARLQLAQRVLRVRPPGRARRARRARPRRRRSRRPPAADLAPAPSRETRDAMWRDAGLGAHAPTGCAGCSTDPHPLARLVAALGARPRGEPRRPCPRRVPGPDPDARRCATASCRRRRATPAHVRWT